MILTRHFIERSKQRGLKPSKVLSTTPADRKSYKRKMKGLDYKAFVECEDCNMICFLSSKGDILRGITILKK